LEVIKLLNRLGSTPALASISMPASIVLLGPRWGLRWRLRKLSLLLGAGPTPPMGFGIANASDKPGPEAISSSACGD